MSLQKRGCPRNQPNCHSEFISESMVPAYQNIEILKQVQDDSSFDFLDSLYVFYCLIKLFLIV
jgi:hypothetical protein